MFNTHIFLIIPHLSGDDGEYFFLCIFVPVINDIGCYGLQDSFSFGEYDFVMFLFVHCRDRAAIANYSKAYGGTLGGGKICVGP